jgi:UDP-N-acetylglucosamine acyltransferase
MTNRVHPTAIIDTSALIGTGNTIGPYAVILGSVQIGDDNWIGPHVVIGTPGEIRNRFHSATWAGDEGSGSVVIGHRNVIREFTTVQSGYISGTHIGNDCYVMTKAHIPHDGVLEDSVTVSCSVMIGGHTIIQEGANLGLGAVVHQRLVIGRRAMVGMGSVVTKAIPPYVMAYGSPALFRGGNVIGMQRAGLDDILIQKVVEALNQSNHERLRELVPMEMEKFDKAEASQLH